MCVCVHKHFNRSLSVRDLLNLCILNLNTAGVIFTTGSNHSHISDPQVQWVSNPVHTHWYIRTNWYTGSYTPRPFTGNGNALLSVTFPDQLLEWGNRNNYKECSLPTRQALHVDTNYSQTYMQVTVIMYHKHMVNTYLSATTLANPKSVSFMWPVLSSRMFSGLRSLTETGVHRREGE